MTIDRSRPVHTGTATVRASARLSLLGLASVIAALFASYSAQAYGADPASSASVGASSVKVPRGFRPYGTTLIDGGECVVGDVTWEGIEGRATIYVDDPSSRQVKWVRSIPLPPRRYQNRATHCVADGDALFVLVQTDTHQQTSLSQTLLSVVELAAADGTVRKTRDEELPGVEDAYSAWVDKGAKGFQKASGQLTISGEYFLMDDPAKRVPFTMAIPAREPN